MMLLTSCEKLILLTYYVLRLKNLFWKCNLVYEESIKGVLGMKENVFLEKNEFHVYFLVFGM